MTDFLSRSPAPLSWRLHFPTQPIIPSHSLNDLEVRDPNAGQIAETVGRPGWSRAFDLCPGSGGLVQYARNQCRRLTSIFGPRISQTEPRCISPKSVPASDVIWGNSPRKSLNLRILGWHQTCVRFLTLVQQPIT